MSDSTSARIPAHPFGLRQSQDDEVRARYAESKRLHKLAEAEKERAFIAHLKSVDEQHKRWQLAM